MGETTTIEIEKSTRTRLRTWKSQHDMTYDEAINELLDDIEDDRYDRAYIDRITIEPDDEEGVDNA